MNSGLVAEAWCGEILASHLHPTAQAERP